MRLADFADGDGAVAGLERDLGAAAVSVLAFQMGIAGLRRGFLQGIRGKLRINVAGMAVGLNFKA